MLFSGRFDEERQAFGKRERVHKLTGDNDVRYDGLAADGARQIGHELGLECSKKIGVFPNQNS